MTQTPFYKPISGTKSPSFEGTTLIVPAVSIGSVAQLAVDLLLHHRELELVKVGRLDPAFCFPFVGPSDSVDGEGDVTTALEGIVRPYTNRSITPTSPPSPAGSTPPASNKFSG
ncbi:hypothetical protein [Sporisorium scitamineum]|uniref:Proteasome assembly chaperone 2 n=1 Tax=Sporisorium scitamineum TaxID=49012 RepID=A0A0F7RVT1_9BASI|nr:hypothetical protein [Sporisorium scitamineum]